MRDSVPSARYSSVCNVLRLWRISLVPTYRVYLLYDIEHIYAIYIYIYRRNGKLCVVKVIQFVLRKHYAILIYALSCSLLHSLQVLLFEEAHCTFTEVRETASEFPEHAHVAVLCSMPPNRCPVFVREGGVALSLPADGVARVTNHFRNNSVRFGGSSLTNTSLLRSR